MTPAELELKRRLKTAKKDMLHHAATLLKLLADDRYEDVVRIAEVIGDRATEAKVMGEAVQDLTRKR